MDRCALMDMGDMILGMESYDNLEQVSSVGISEKIQSRERISGTDSSRVAIRPGEV